MKGLFQPVCIKAFQTIVPKSNALQQIVQKVWDLSSSILGLVTRRKNDKLTDHVTLDTELSQSFVRRRRRPSPMIGRWMVAGLDVNEVCIKFNQICLCLSTVWICKYKVIHIAVINDSIDTEKLSYKRYITGIDMRVMEIIKASW